MRVLSFLLLIGLVSASDVHAALRVDISKGVESSMLIAVPHVVARAPVTGASTSLGADIADVIQNDLASTGLFSPVSRDSYAMSMPVADTERPRFALWRATRAQALVAGAVAPVDTDNFRFECRLFDVFSGDAVAARNFVGPKDQWRRVAHVCANFIHEALVGERGHFDSRILYVSESGTQVKRTKRLAEMDYDGANHRYLSKGLNLVSMPAYAPSGTEIAHLAFDGRVAKIFLVDLVTRSAKELGPFAGMAFGPRFSPNGQSLLLSISQGGNTDVYRLDLASSKVTRLTDAPGIDTGASYSPDGQKIVFESNRSGSPQLYTMDADGSGQTRISFGAGRYGAVAWSPRGDLLAFTRTTGGVFRVGVMRTDGRGEKMLTPGPRDESPTWSPSGRAIAFARTGASPAPPQLWTVDVTGTVERRLMLPQGGSDASWSPSRDATLPPAPAGR
jgi:TolB protein